jgi:FAD binding domain
VSPHTSQLLGLLRTRLRAGAVCTDADARAGFGSDLAHEGTPPIAVVAPSTLDELQSLVRTVGAAGVPFAPRGGGTSYSRGYLIDAGEWISIDTRRLDRVVEVNEQDGYVTVEAGCTWEKLLATLAPLALRPPAWGPYSGRHATVGATVAQNAAFYGSARHGTVADSVLGLAVVLPDGSMLDTGAAAHREHSTPFFRHWGPDLTGLFTSSCGAFGVHARVTLRLVPVPAATCLRGYHLSTPVDVARAMSGIARSAVAAECLCVGPLMQAGSAPAAAFNLSTVHEGDSQTLARASAERADEIVATSGGRRAGAGMLGDLRAPPFAAPGTLIGPAGRRWLPLHVIVPHSRHADTLQAIDDYLRVHTAALAERGFSWRCVSMLIGRSAVLIEPGFYWPDVPSPVTRSLLDERTLAGAVQTAQPALRAEVIRLRHDLMTHLVAAGGVNLQIGRDYPYSDRLARTSLAVLEALKEILDPRDLANRGVLGLRRARPPR